MKKVGVIFLVLIMMCGCSRNNGGFDRAMALRTGLLNGSGCQFEAQITADFGDKSYSFLLECQADAEGTVNFIVRQPEYIDGIAGSIQARSGKLVFDDKALAFPLIADGALSPISGPWIIVKALRSGYVRNCAEEDGLFRMTVDDSFSEDAFTLNIWLSDENGPIRADIYEANRRIMAIEIKNFQLK